MRSPLHSPARAQSRAAHVAVSVRRSAHPDGYALEEVLYRRSSRLHGSAVRLPVKALEHPAALRRLNRARGDVLHLQWLAAPEVDAWLLRPRAPLVLTAHDLLPRRTARRRRTWRRSSRARPGSSSTHSRARHPRRVRRRPGQTARDPHPCLPGGRPEGRTTARRCSRSGRSARTRGSTTPSRPSCASTAPACWSPAIRESRSTRSRSRAGARAEWRLGYLEDEALARAVAGVHDRGLSLSRRARPVGRAPPGTRRRCAGRRLRRRRAGRAGSGVRRRTRRPGRRRGRSRLGRLRAPGRSGGTRGRQGRALSVRARSSPGTRPRTPTSISIGTSRDLPAPRPVRRPRRRGSSTSSRRTRRTCSRRPPRRRRRGTRPAGRRQRSGTETSSSCSTRSVTGCWTSARPTPPRSTHRLRTPTGPRSVARRRGNASGLLLRSLPTTDATRIEDYGLIGDMQTAALVSRRARSTGCAPRFDSRRGASPRSSETPTTGTGRSSRRDARRPRTGRHARPGDRVRDGRRGSAPSTACRARRGRRRRADRRGVRDGRCGWSWCSASTTARSSPGSALDGPSRAVAGPDAVPAHAGRPRGGDLRTSPLHVSPGERLPFVLTWFPSPSRPPMDAGLAPTTRSGLGRAAAVRRRRRERSSAR